MKQISNRLIPMHKKLIKDMMDNIVIQRLNKFLTKNMIILIKY